MRHFSCVNDEKYFYLSVSNAINPKEDIDDSYIFGLSYILMLEYYIIFLGFFPIAENFKTDSGKNNTIETYLFEKLPRSQWYFCRH